MIASLMAQLADTPELLPLARVSLTYLWRHGKLPDLRAPTTFTELVQHRKLNDRDPRLPMLADKVAVKAHVADRLGGEWVIPTLWHGTRLPDAPQWPAPFVVKSRHGCNQNAFVLDDDIDWPAIRRASRRWMGTRYGGWLDEWLYGAIPRGLLVEPFVGEAGRLPLDYKLYVFGGRVEYIQVHLDRAGAHRWVLFDRDWARVSTPTGDDPAPPVSLSAMIAAAETLGEDIDFVRADFYEIAGRPMFGELTFYPGSGLDPFDPPALDARIGASWLRVRPAPAPASADWGDGVPSAI
ncbi:hypothetical protein M9980_08445 [Sphingomonas donggukensis]|uniref:Polysaccharide biosynthesis protein n=1 Tax=Sphingomonas donggukensis TaxID=2949093 RepID=A0ABY4TS00_9SPHN|nr:ATP-grasp fold amidoligase family protein [Sphingomonas donggukensis]URW74605.1 hypothetical protein M9980_08445 [Sphingomonas donggukensis]